MKNLFLTILFSLIIGLSTACGVISGGIEYGGADVSAPFRDNSTAYIVCSAECLAQGQCGTVELPGRVVQVVLINKDEPKTKDHNAFIEANQAITLLDSRVMNMVVPASGDRYEMTFYNVQFERPNESPIEGWVHGMCVANKAQ